MCQMSQTIPQTTRPRIADDGEWIATEVAIADADRGTPTVRTTDNDPWGFLDAENRPPDGQAEITDHDPWAFLNGE